MFRINVVAQSVLAIAAVACYYDTSHVGLRAAPASIAGTRYWLVASVCDQHSAWQHANLWEVRYVQAYMTEYDVVAVYYRLCDCSVVDPH